MRDDLQADGLAARFIDALRHLEQSGDVEPMVALYAADGVAGNVLHVDAFDGPDGVRSFWTGYRAQFGDVRSDFTHVVESSNAAALEWSTEATINDQPVTYRGVTVVEGAGDVIRRSCAYFDPALLVPPSSPA